MSETSADLLGRFCQNLTVLAQTQPFAEQPAYAKEIARALQVLERRYNPGGRRGQRYNPVFLGEDAAERWQAWEGAAAALMKDDAPAAVHGRVPLLLDYEAIMDGVDADALVERDWAIKATYPSSYLFKDLADDAVLNETFQRHMHERQEWLLSNAAYQRLRAVLYALVEASPPSILIVNHLHRLFGGDFIRYPFDMASTLKPLFGHDQIQLWGACSLEAYRRHIESDAAMQRRFTEICLPSTRNLLG